MKNNQSKEKQPGAFEMGMQARSKLESAFSKVGEFIQGFIYQEAQATQNSEKRHKGV